MSEFEQNLCCGAESEEANLASLRETLALPGLRPVDVKRALCLYALKYGRSSKLNPREVQIVAESKSIVGWYLSRRVGEYLRYSI